MWDKADYEVNFSLPFFYSPVCPFKIPSYMNFYITNLKDTYTIRMNTEDIWLPDIELYNMIQ